MLTTPLVTLGLDPRVSGLDFSLVFEVPVAVEFSGVAGLAGHQKQTRLSLSGLTRESTVATEERRQRGRITALKHRFWHLPWTPGSSPRLSGLVFAQVFEVVVAV